MSIAGESPLSPFGQRAWRYAEYEVEQWLGWPSESRFGGGWMGSAALLCLFLFNASRFFVSVFCRCFYVLQPVQEQDLSPRKPREPPVEVEEAVTRREGMSLESVDGGSRLRPGFLVHFLGGWWFEAYLGNGEW